MPRTALRHRRSIRLKGYDYATPGAYFVTTCAQGRQTLFGALRGETIDLNDYGRTVDTAWRELADRYSYVLLDSHIVMPDHFHGVLWILDPDRRGGSRATPTDPIKPVIKPLGQLIGAFKTISAKRINLLRGTPGHTVWQRDFYERIGRRDELDRIRRYIENNPRHHGIA